MNWMLGIGFVAMLAISQLAFHQRDEARKANKAEVIVDSATITVTCKPTTTGEGGE